MLEAKLLLSWWFWMWVFRPSRHDKHPILFWPLYLPSLTASSQAKGLPERFHVLLGILLPSHWPSHLHCQFCQSLHLLTKSHMSGNPQGQCCLLVHGAHSWDHWQSLQILVHLVCQIGAQGFLPQGYWHGESSVWLAFENPGSKSSNSSIILSLFEVLSQVILSIWVCP